MTEIILEKFYDKASGRYLGKMVISTDDLAEMDKVGGGIIQDINEEDKMGFRRYEKQIRKQKEYILRYAWV